MNETKIDVLGEEETAAAEGSEELDSTLSQQSDQDQWRVQLQESRAELAKDPRNVALLNKVGKLAEASGDLDRAFWAYKRAIRLDETYAESYQNLGALYEKEGRSKQAALTLQNYLRYAGDGADIEPALQLLQRLQGGESPDSAELCVESAACKQLNQKWTNLGLTPGEALYLLDPENSDGQDMLRYTLLDMIMKGILKVDERYGVGRGENFSDIELEPHEVVFAKYFSKYRDLIDLDRLAQTVALELNGRFDLYKNDYVRFVLEDKGYVEEQSGRVGGVLPIKRYGLSNSGVRVSSQLKRLLKEAGIQMEEAARKNPQQANAFVSEGGPAILLMESYPPGIFQNWLNTLERIGLGPAIQKTRTRLLDASSSDRIDDFVKSIFGG